jgi:site-specific DNA-adenine methylase
MFSYYGSKSKVINLYPPPKYGKVIEPFCGSARYSLKYYDRDILLVDNYDAVIAIWHYLQQASEKDIIGLPNLVYGETTAHYNLSEGERLFLGFLVARGARRPQKIVQKFSSVEQDKRRVAQQLFKIRHWTIKKGDYRDIENQEATWFVDPPYQHGGESYNTIERGSSIDFSQLAEWCKSRYGQQIICENTRADWLPFQPLKEMHGQLHRSGMD